MPDTPALHINNLIVTGERGRQILDIPALDIAPGSLIGIRGPSGAGKSTLLHALAGLLDGSQGVVKWGETDLNALSQSAKTAFRQQHIGIIFQDFLLFDELCAIGNAGIAALYAPKAQRTALRHRAADELKNRGIAEFGRSVENYSGGERQRVAIARALAHDPPILLADEPTASLDTKTGAALIADLTTIARNQGRTLIVVSHDAQLLDRLDRTITIAEGHLSAGDTT